MKRLIYAILGIGVVGIGIGFYGSRPGKELLPSARPVAESTSSPSLVDTKPVKPAAAGATPLRRVSADTTRISRRTSSASPGSIEAKLDGSAVFNQALDTLLSPHVSFEQKQAAWKQLKETGKLDQAISELEQRMTKDPQAAEYPATLGQAYLRKSETLQDVREMGILAMKADKVFDAALSLDPANWEARFTKAVALSYWPAFLNKGQEVVEHFQTLVQQQETQPPQPQFAMTYARLGDQYQKAGNADDAKQVWQRGGALYPNDPELRTKLASSP